MINIKLVIILFIIFYISPQIFSKELMKSEKIKKVISFLSPDDKKKLIIDNIYGSIHIIGYEGEKVFLNIQKIIKAESAIYIKAAIEKYPLEILNEKEHIRLYVDGPIRLYDKRHPTIEENQIIKFRVIYNFIIKAPYDTDLELKTVSNGNIFVKNIYGDYFIKHINGEIQMENIEGSGQVSSVNGDVNIKFRKNPQKKWHCSSVNGDIKLYFQPELSANIFIKMFNGDVWSEFQIMPLKLEPIFTAKKNEKNIYTLENRYGVRIGKGGPEIMVEGFNGNIFVLKQ